MNTSFQDVMVETVYFYIIQEREGETVLISLREKFNSYFHFGPITLLFFQIQGLNSNKFLTHGKKTILFLQISPGEKRRSGK